MTGKDDARLLAALGHTVDTVIVIDAHGVVQLVSPSGPAIFNYDPDVVIGMNALDLIHPDDAVLALQALASTTGRPGRNDPLDLRIQDGWGRWRNVTIVPVNLLGDPVVAGIVVTVRDQTGAPEYERRLTERDDRYRQVVELAAEGVWILDEEDRTSFVSARMAAMLGLRPEDMEGRSVLDFIDDDAAEEAQDLIERRRLGISEDYPFRLRHLDGGDVWVRVAATPVLDHDGTYRGAIAMVSDQTSRHREQERAARVEATHVAMLEAVPDAVYRLTADGTYLAARSSESDFVLLGPEELIGRKVGDLFPAVERDRIMGAITETLATGHVQRYEYTLDLGRGPVEFEARIAPVADDEVVAVVRDLTDLRAAEAARRDLALEVEQRRADDRLRAERDRAARLESLDRLAGGIAHDINNLLGVIANHAGVLGLHDLGPGTREDVRAIEEAVGRGSELTRRLLLLGRGQEPEVGVVDLARLVAGLGPDLRAQAPGRDVRVMVTSEACPVLADPGRVEQAVNNLVLNAVDATRPGDAIEVEVTPGRSAAGAAAVVLSVGDRGTGMDPEVAQRAFEPYFTTKGPDRGTGLGLSIAHSTVSDVGGTARIESPQGGGTRIVLEFPAAGSSGNGSAPTRRGSGDGTLTVLVVEDDPDALRSVSRLLEASGLTVVVASSGMEAEARLRGPSGTVVDVVLTDVVMPQVSGPALAARLRASHPEVPVVLMTAFGADQLPDRTEALPVLHKPLDVDEVIATLRAAVNAAV
jgi:PAS domain S-box-containing protein